MSNLTDVVVSSKLAKHDKHQCLTYSPWWTTGYESVKGGKLLGKKMACAAAMLRVKFHWHRWLV